MSASDLKAYVGASDAQMAYVSACWDAAKELVDHRVGETVVPDGVLSRACLEVGAELFHRRAAKNGVAQFGDGEASPMRIARDPMVAAYPLLAPWLPGGFA